MDNNPATKSSPKPHFPMPMIDSAVDQNGAFCLRAEVLGYPAPSVIFYKDDADEPLMAQSQLHRTARNPAGTYELIAENTHGSVSCKAHVLPRSTIPTITGSPTLTNGQKSATPEIRRPLGLPPNGRARIASNQSNTSLLSGSRESSIMENLRQSTSPSLASLASSETKRSPDGGKNESTPPERARVSSSLKKQPSQASSGSSASLENQSRAAFLHRKDSIENAKTLSEVRNQMKQRRILAPNFGSSIDKVDSEKELFQSPEGSATSIMEEEAEHQKHPEPRNVPTVPAYCGPPVPYVSKRAASPTDSEYFSGGYESACMETPTQSPIASPVPLIEQLILPYEEQRSSNSHATSDSEAYMTSNEQVPSDVESLKRSNSNYGITSEEEYLTAGGFILRSNEFRIAWKKNVEI